MRWVRFSVVGSVLRLVGEAVEYRLEVTGLDSGGEASARAGLCGLLLLRKERRRMKGLEIVSIAVLRREIQRRRHTQWRMICAKTLCLLQVVDHACSFRFPAYMVPYDSAHSLEV